MDYKVTFHAFIDGKKQNLDATFESASVPTKTDKAVIRAVMSALSDVVQINDPNFTIEFHIDLIAPVV